MALSQNTLNNYRTKLKKLRRALPNMPEEHPRRAAVIREIEKLTNILGKEMTDLESFLAKRPGRQADVTGPAVSSKEVDQFDPKVKEQQDAAYWSAEAIEARHKAKMAELAEFKSSADVLDGMAQALGEPLVTGGDQNGQDRPNTATDVAREVNTTNPTT